jgi:hypothetical protein
MFKIKLEDYLKVIENLNSITKYLENNKLKKVSNIIPQIEKIVFSTSQILENDDFVSLPDPTVSTSIQTQQPTLNPVIVDSSISSSINNYQDPKFLSIEINNLKDLIKSNNDLIFNKIAAIETSISNIATPKVNPVPAKLPLQIISSKAQLNSIVDPLPGKHLIPAKQPLSYNFSVAQSLPTVNHISFKAPSSALNCSVSNATNAITSKYSIGTCAKSCTLKSATRSPPSSHLFVTRFDPSTTKKDISEYLASINIPFSEVYAVRSKFSSYSSFCIKCFSSDFKTIQDSSHWPSGIIIMPFKSPKIIHPDNSETIIRKPRLPKPINIPNQQQ